MAASNLFEDLVDQYKIEQHLGEKHYTDRYRAYDVDEDRSVTLDVLRPPAAADPAFTGRLLARAKALAQIRHPNIPRIYDIGKTPDGRAYVAQALVEGYPLSQRLEQLTQRDAPANSIYALKLVRQVAEALLLAERLDFPHYDLQPENIWLKNVALPTDDTVLLLDLFIPVEGNGSAPSTDSGPMLAYLSPEQRQQKEVDSSSHVYSLGAMLYSLLSGDAPGAPVRLQDFVAQRLASGPTALERARTNLARETYDLVDRSMRRDPARRFTTIEQFLVALDGALAAEEIHLHQGRGLDHPNVRRTWAIAIPALVLALFLVAGLVAARGVQTRSGLAVEVSRTRDATEALAVIPQAGASPAGGVAALPAAASPTLTSTVEATPAASPTMTALALPAGYPPPAGYPSASGDPSPTALLTDETEMPTPTPTPTIPPSPTATATATIASIARVRIALNSVNLRGGPGVVFPQIGSLLRDDVVTVLARAGRNDSVWLLIDRGDGRAGWLSADMAEPVEDFDLEAVPTAVTVPPPPPTATPTPIPTPSPSPTVLAPTPEEPDGGGEPRPTNEPAPTEAPPPTRTPPPLGTP